MERYGESVVSPEEASAPVYPYVYVTSEGQVHELDDEDRAYLEERFYPMDPARPATKFAFEDKDGKVGKGFCHRSLLPAGTVVNSEPVARKPKPAIEQGERRDGSSTAGIPLRFLLVGWLVISVIASIPLNGIKWGSPDGFHGTGWPFASVYWDRLQGAEDLVDFPNPLAPFYNIAVILLVGALPLLFLRLLIRLWRAWLT